MSNYKSQTAKIIERSSLEFLNNHKQGMVKAIESAKEWENKLREINDHSNADKHVARYTEMQDSLNEFQDFRILIGK
jgi:cell fate (sporulation/competence/biofilm development) regulator YlbF (YheA/YmcA/DUF963 family)